VIDRQYDKKKKENKTKTKTNFKKAVTQLLRIRGWLAATCSALASIPGAEASPRNSSAIAAVASTAPTASALGISSSGTCTGKDAAMFDFDFDFFLIFF
jgi:hypothetical protein